MKLAIDIDGREAIPVRALPWITGWHFGVHEVAEALSGDDNESRTPFTTAYWLDGGGAKHAIPKDHWVMTSQCLEQAEDAGLINQDWHAVATRLLPEGVWVWADEWATAYENSPDGPGQMELIAETPEDWQDVASRRIQFAPFIPPELRGEILAGFDRLAESEGGADAVEMLNPVTDAVEPEAKPVPQAVPAVQAEANAVVGSANHEEWKLKAQSLAKEIIERDRKKDLYPSQENLADEVARVLRQKCIFGSGGKPLTGAYIKRHALKGISSAQGKQLSTAIHRGK